MSHELCRMAMDRFITQTFCSIKMENMQVVLLTNCLHNIGFWLEVISLEGWGLGLWRRWGS